MQRTSLLVATQPALDDRWYATLESLSAEASEVYYPLEPNPVYLAEAYKNFLAHYQQTNPDLYPKLANRQLYEMRHHELAALNATILAEETNEPVKQAYIARISELEAQLGLLLAADAGDTDTFTALNQRIYHGPDPDVFAATCNWLRTVAEEQTEHPDKAIVQTAKEVLSRLPKTPQSGLRLVPSEETFAKVRALHTSPGGFFDQLFAGATLPAEVTETTGDAIVEQVLANIGCDYDVMESSNPNWGVSHTDRAVIHPVHYSASERVFAGVLVHEIGSHLLERMNGLRQPLRLLASGLDRYDHCNEGRAYLREQIIYNEPTYMLRQDSWRHIITLHLAISLAVGLYEHPYGFAEAFHVLNPIDLLWRQLQGLPAAEAQEQAKNDTWHTLTRVMKGTDGTGSAYLKDIVYLEGNIRCWQLAESRPEMILWGDLGKFDLARPDHLALLRSLDILPA